MTPTFPSIGRLYVGASGFSYPSWRGDFYPAGSRPSDFLRYYAERLPSVEINSTFHNVPSEAAVRGWAETAPPGFRFALKLSRRALWDLEQLDAFAARARLLGEHLGPIRLVVTRRRDDGYLRALLAALDAKLRWAFDFRHPSWDSDDLPEEAGAVRVGALVCPAPFLYVRLREPPYDEASLTAWADRLRPALASGTDVYCYFKHEDEPTAPAYAARLLELVDPVGDIRG
jgi:uncharacterized protein YecE (DUF72 family)